MPKAQIFQRHNDPDQAGVWSVEVINRFGDGEGEVTIFYGPYSEARARQYAELVEREAFPEPAKRREDDERASGAPPRGRVN